MYSYYENFFNKLALLLKTVVMGGPLTYNFSIPGNLLGKVRLPENPVKIKYHPHCALIHCVESIFSKTLHEDTQSNFYMLPILQLSQYTDECFRMVYSMDRHFTCQVIYTPHKKQ